MIKKNKVALITGVTFQDGNYLTEIIYEDLNEERKEYLLRSQGFSIFESKE